MRRSFGKTETDEEAWLLDGTHKCENTEEKRITFYFEDGGIMFPQNISTHLPDYTVS
jgi:hypothetical protein